MFNCPQPSSQFKKAVKSTGSNPEKGAGGDEKGQKKKKKGGESPHQYLLLPPYPFSLRAPLKSLGGRDAATALP